jgi:hypothetical protein
MILPVWRLTRKAAGVCCRHLRRVPPKNPAFNPKPALAETRIPLQINDSWVRTKWRNPDGTGDR